MLDDLPYRLKIQTCMNLYKDYYEKVRFLSQQNENFLGWICPHLKQVFMPAEDFIYFETDGIEDIFFLVKGRAAFVVPFLENVVYIEIEAGDKFGEMDIVNTSLQTQVSLDNVVKQLHTTSKLLMRHFTVQSI